MNPCDILHVYIIETGNWPTKMKVQQRNKKIMTLEVKLETGYEEKDEGVLEEVTLAKNLKPQNRKTHIKVLLKILHDV